MALQRLSTTDRAKVKELTGAYHTPEGREYDSFGEACTFPDLARERARDDAPGWDYFRRFDQWHYMNVPRDTTVIEESACGNNCVLRGIRYHKGRLANGSLDPWKRAQALFFLGHWVGDVHQPLHVSFEDDSGGGRITGIHGGFYSQRSLHSVWDSGIIEKAMGDQSEEEYADALLDGISSQEAAAWKATTPVQWAQESYDVTISNEADYCEWTNHDEGPYCSSEGSVRTLGQSYQERFQKVVEKRLQQAAVRLAEQIKTALHPPS